MINRTARFYRKQRWTSRNQRVAPKAISEFQALDNSNRFSFKHFKKEKLHIGEKNRKLVL